jgi:hypothetical protein
MAALTVTATTAAGTVLPAASAADVAGDTFANTGRELIEINNADASSKTVTFTTTGTYNIGAVQYAIADLAVVVSNGTSKVCGPFDTSLFSSTVTIAYSAVTSVTVRVISLGLA